MNIGITTNQPTKFRATKWDLKLLMIRVELIVNIVKV